MDQKKSFKMSEKKDLQLNDLLKLLGFQKKSLNLS
jgi:hypothetical protein